MATSTLRGLILVALVVLGFLGLTKLFPQNTSLGVAPGTTTASHSPSASPSIGSSPSTTRKPRPKSQVMILVLNGNSKAGQAALTRETLQGDGYKTKPPDNYTQKVQTTIIFYQPDFLPEAQRLQRQRFPGAELKPAPATLASDVDLEVVVGADQVT